MYLALHNEPLFEDEIQAWRYGPVCPPAYKFYCKFEAEQLPIPTKEFMLEIPDEPKEVLEEIWGYFGGYHAYRLSDMTHGEFPWKKARRGMLPEASSTKAILIEDMKALGQQKLDLIERENLAYEPVMTQVLNNALLSEPKRIRKGEIRDWLNSLLD